MIYGFYFRFYKYTRIKWLSVVLAYLTRFLFFVRFLFMRGFLKKHPATMTEDEAIDILNKACPDAGGQPETSMKERDENLDLSIIIPVYNHEDKISKCIDSVMNQDTRYSFELILVDDGSTDGAANIVDNYKNNSKATIIHQNNSGIAAARNTGIANAGGAFIMFVDCDDCVEASIVEELLSAAYDNNSDIAMCAHDLIKVRDNRIVDVIPNIYPQVNMLGYKNGDEIMNYAGLPWGKVYRRELFEQVRFFPGYWYEDTIVQSLLFTQCCEFTYVPKVLYHYYWHEVNYSHVQSGNVFQPKMVDRYWLIRAICNQYSKMNLPINEIFYTMIVKHLSMYYCNTITSLPNPLFEAMFVMARQLLLKYKPKEKVRMPYMLTLTEKALLQRDISLWKLCSSNQ